MQIAGQFTDAKEKEKGNITHREKKKEIDSKFLTHNTEWKHYMELVL